MGNAVMLCRYCGKGWGSVLVCQRARAVRRGERCRAGRRRAERAMVSDKVSVEGAVDICRQEVAG